MPSGDQEEGRQEGAKGAGVLMTINVKRDRPAKHVSRRLGGSDESSYEGSCTGGNGSRNGRPRKGEHLPTHDCSHGGRRIHLS